MGLTDLEIASGVVCSTPGHTAGPARGPRQPLEALEASLLPALESPPLVVAFSGGRDSSALLAAATRLARREGLEPPVAITARWVDDPDSDEQAWQELVIRTLGVADWECLESGTDLDLLGPVACEALERHGLFWPAPAYAMLPFLHRARGGTLISGEGGDEVFGWWPLAPLRSAMAERRWPTRGQRREALLRALPYRGRLAATKRSAHPYQHWLGPEAFEAQRDAMAAERAASPLSWRRYLSQVAASRDLELTVSTMQRFGAAVGASFTAPFLAPAFVHALGRLGGWQGIGDRTAVMSAVFGEILPVEVLSRVSKATFGRAFWGPMSREFAARWDGEGLPLDLVRPTALKAAWQQEVPVYGSALPLHAAWLVSRPAPPPSHP